MVDSLSAALRDLAIVSASVDDLVARPDVWRRTVEHLGLAELHVAWLIDQLAGHAVPHLPDGRRDTPEALRFVIRFLATQLDGLRRVVDQLPDTRLLEQGVGVARQHLRLAALEVSTVKGGV